MTKHNRYQIFSLLTESLAKKPDTASTHKYWKGWLPPALVFPKRIKRGMEPWPAAPADPANRSEGQQGETVS